MPGARHIVSTSVAVFIASLGIAHAQSPATQVSGTFGASGPGGSLAVTFTCTGVPTCVGQFNLTERTPECANTLTQSDPITITGLDLARSGSLSGSVTLAKALNSYDILADGSCRIKPGATDAIVPYNATWDAASGTGTFTVLGDVNYVGTIRADIASPAPVFPMTVTASINVTTATATAAIRFRAPDVGTQGNVYTFAYAPVARVRGAVAAKADPPIACALAQLDATGQLVAAGAGPLQAAASGVLSAQGATVSILNGVATPNVAGATFYVGYGPSSASMLDNGVFRNAVSVPGSGACPMLSSQTALWWNPAESGWGVNLSHQGNILFATLFTYDRDRTPLWLVMSDGQMQSDGASFTGDLYRTTGPAFDAVPFAGTTASKVGSMTVSFVDVNTATLRYTFDGVEVRKGIQRQVFGSRAAACFPSTASRAASSHYQDLWWNPAESGWGVNVTHQDNTLFATLFTYQGSGRGLWLVMSAGQRQPDGSYLGDLFATTGPAFDASPFAGVAAAAVGTMRMRFADGNNGTLTYTYNGTTVTKAITRQVFSSPLPACN